MKDNNVKAVVSATGSYCGSLQIAIHEYSHPNPTSNGSQGTASTAASLDLTPVVDAPCAASIPQTQIPQIQIQPQIQPRIQPQIQPPQIQIPLTPLPPKLLRVGLKDFDLLSVIGRGAYGKVFLVKQKYPHKKSININNAHSITQLPYFAMKVLKKATLLIHHKDAEHTLNERQILEAIQHPFIVRLYYAFQTSHKLYLILGYAMGGELFSYLARERMFREEWVQFYAAELLLALEHLHGLGIIYRDLKPENVLLGGDGHVLLTDFGLSKVALDGAARTVCGTAEFMAPEIITLDIYLDAVEKRDRDQQQERQQQQQQPVVEENTSTIKYPVNTANATTSTNTSTVSADADTSSQIPLQSSTKNPSTTPLPQSSPLSPLPPPPPPPPPPYTVAVDYWSLGIMIYDMLTGSPPFTGPNRKRVMDAVLKRKLTCPKYLTSSAKDLCGKLLRKEPELRLGSGGGGSESNTGRKNGRNNTSSSTSSKQQQRQRNASSNALSSLSAGADEVKQHAFFKGWDWQKVLNKGYKPPFLPSITSFDDTSNFDVEFTQMAPVDTPPSTSFSIHHHHHIDHFTSTTTSTTTPCTTTVNNTTPDRDANNSTTTTLSTALSPLVLTRTPITVGEGGGVVGSSVVGGVALKKTPSSASSSLSSLLLSSKLSSIKSQGHSMPDNINTISSSPAQQQKHHQQSSSNMNMVKGGGVPMKQSSSSSSTSSSCSCALRDALKLSSNQLQQQRSNNSIIGGIIMSKKDDAGGGGGASSGGSSSSATAAIDIKHTPASARKQQQQSTMNKDNKITLSPEDEDDLDHEEEEEEDHLLDDSPTSSPTNRMVESPITSKLKRALVIGGAKPTNLLARNQQKNSSIGPSSKIPPSSSTSSTAPTAKYTKSNQDQEDDLDLPSAFVTSTCGDENCAQPHFHGFSFVSSDVFALLDEQFMNRTEK